MKQISRLDSTLPLTNFLPVVNTEQLEQIHTTALWLLQKDH